MKRKIVIILAVILLVLIVIQVAAPNMLKSAAPDILNQDLDDLTRFVTTKMMQGNLLSLIPKNQLNEVVDRLEAAEIPFEENPELKAFMEEKGITQEKILSQLRSRSGLKQFRKDLLLYMRDVYCREQNIDPEAVTNKELYSYQAEHLAGILHDVLGRLQAGEK